MCYLLRTRKNTHNTCKHLTGQLPGECVWSLCKEHLVWQRGYRQGQFSAIEVCSSAAVHTCRKCTQRVRSMSFTLTVCVCRRTCGCFGLSASEACTVFVDSRTYHPFSVSRPLQGLSRCTCHFKVAANIFGLEQGSGAQAAGRNILIRYTYSDESAAERRNCYFINCSSFQKASGGAVASICMPTCIP